MSKFHPRNKHQSSYDFEQLLADTPELEPYLILNPKGTQTINFHDPLAVKTLNKALLKTFYQIEKWDIPDGYLCPPVPGRADYIHHLADVLAAENGNKIPKGKNIKCLDVGVGANCIYPIIGCRAYGWHFIGADIDERAIEVAKNTVSENLNLKNKIEIRFQPNENQFFKGILKSDERVDLTICNPPFHTSLREAEKGTARKIRNLKLGQKSNKIIQNFGGKSHELRYKGGERKFIESMIRESKEFATNCLWFSTLVSKKENLKPIEGIFEKIGIAQRKTIELAHGNKISRAVVWTFLSKKQRDIWRQLRWN